MATLVLAGCSSTGALQVSGDTYMISRQSAGGAFASMGTLKAKVIKEANEFAASKGKVAIPISAQESRPNIGLPSFEYQFQLVDKDDPRAKGGALIPRADVVIEKTEKVTADISTKDTNSKKQDVYTELTKLDNLRKKGILTEEEFLAEKKKLLGTTE